MLLAALLLEPTTADQYLVNRKVEEWNSISLALKIEDEGPEIIHWQMNNKHQG